MFLLTYLITFEPETSAGHPKYQDSDCSLVSSKNFSEILPPNGWRPLMMSVTKNPHPPTKNFFRVQSTRPADPFKTLNSSLAQSSEELGRW